MAYTREGEMINSLLTEFEKFWNEPNYTRPYMEVKEEYRRMYEEKQLFNKMVAEQKRIARCDTIPSVEVYTLQPNSMQRAFI